MYQQTRGYFISVIMMLIILHGVLNDSNSYSLLFHSGIVLKQTQIWLFVHDNLF